MDEKIRCQSCGMPLGAPGFYGTDDMGQEIHEYCKFCYQNGKFTQPEMTLQGMIDLSVDNMTSEQNMTLEQAQQLANDFIPKLKRWKKSDEEEVETEIE